MKWNNQELFQPCETEMIVAVLRAVHPETAPFTTSAFFVLENIVDVLRTIHPQTAPFTKSVLFCILQDVIDSREDHP